MLYRLGVFFVKCNKGGVTVQIGLNLCLISTVKDKQDLYLVLVDLNNSVSKKQLLRVSTKLKIVSINIKVGYVFLMLMS